MKISAEEFSITYSQLQLKREEWEKKAQNSPPFSAVYLSKCCDKPVNHHGKTTQTNHFTA